MKYPVVLVMLAACGSVADTPPDAAPGEHDAPPGTPDANEETPRCDPAKPFGAATAVTELNSPSTDTSVALSADELTAVISSSRSGNYDLFIATRANRDDAFSAPTALAGVNTTAGSENRPSLLDDQLTMYAEQRVSSSAQLRIARSTRTSTTAAFGPLVDVAGVNAASPVSNYSPFIVPDGTALYFASNRVALDNFDLYVAPGSNGTFGTPALVSGTSLATTSTEEAPVLTPDQLNLYFTSDRPGSAAADIWYASRASQVSAFGAPALVASVNTSGAEFPSWVSADNCVLYFVRNVTPGAVDSDIYVARKPL